MWITRWTAETASKKDYRWMGKKSPGRRQVMFRSLMNTKPSHLLDTNLFDFLGLQRELIDEHKIQSDSKIRDIVE